MRILKVFSLLLALALLALPVRAATFNVNNTSDATNAGAGQLTLRGALDAANATPEADTINLTVSGTYLITTLQSGSTPNTGGPFAAIPAGGDLSIVNTSGGNVVLDGNLLSQVIAINPNDEAGTANVTLDGVMITNGVGTVGGGGVLCRGVGVSLTVQNSTFTNCFSSTNGAALSVTGGPSLVLNNCVLTNNKATLGNGGGLFSDDASITVTNCLFDNNVGQGSGAGALQIAAPATLRVISSVLSNNNGYASGGAIQQGANTVLILQDSTFFNNTSGSVGGAISFGGTTLTATNCNFRTNVAGAQGGAILLANTGTGAARSALSNCTFSSNRSINFRGGAIFHDTAGDVDLDSCTFNGNLALDRGGAIFWNSASVFALRNTIVAGNQALTSGPDLANAAGNFTDNGNNLIGVSGAGSDNTGFGAASTLQGTTAAPLDPLLGPVQDNGGPTWTQALLTGSPALQAGATALTTDQRGVARPQGAAPDVGAFEALPGPLPSGSVSPAIVSFGNQVVGSGPSAAQLVTITNTGDGDLTVSSVGLSGVNPTEFGVGGTFPATVAAGGTLSVPVTFTAGGIGDRSAILTFTSDNFGVANSKFSVNLTGNGLANGGPDFSITANPTSADVQPGGSTQVTFTVTPQNGFNLPVSFTVSGLPANATATFEPPTVTPNGAPVSSVLTISEAPVAQRGWTLLAWAPALVGCLFLLVGRRKRLALLLVTFGLAGAMFGCSGEDRVVTNTVTQTVTETNTVTNTTTPVVVTARTGDGSVSHQATVNITLH